MSLENEEAKTTFKTYNVDSSNIKSIGYNLAKKTLQVTFASKKVYNYSNVPAEIVSNLLFADSIGSYFNANVRESFKFKEV